MAVNKKKTILAYFLQKTSGTYSESSLSYLYDLLRREGIVTSADSLESLASELALLVRDGSYLKISTKKSPEHIRAQIDFHLQKSRRNSKKSSASTSSAFDDLLASIDSDDPKFTMDTTLGLGFSTLEELESDLKKHAIDSLSPSLFSRSTRTQSPGYAQDSYASTARISAPAPDMSEEALDVATIDDLYERESQQQQSLSQHAKSVSQSADAMRAASSHVDDTASQLRERVQRQSLSDITSAHPIPQFPSDTPMHASLQQSYPSFVQQTPCGVPTFANVQSSMQSYDLHAQSDKQAQQQLFAQLQLRASLLDAKERLLAQRVSSTNDPAILRAVALIDEKLAQFVQQQESAALASQQQQSALVSSVTGSHAGIGTTSSGKAQSLSSQIKSYVQELIGAQKSMHELQQVFAQSAQQTAQAVSAAQSFAQPLAQPAAQVQQITPAQARELAKKEKHDVAQLRAQLTQLQEQFSLLSAQLTQNLAAQQLSHAQHGAHRARVPTKVKSLKATAVDAHTLRSSGLLAPLAPQRQLALQEASVAHMPASFADQDATNVQTVETDFGSDTPTLQKMYALLAVGMRELSVSPQRARHIYEQLQRLYTTLSFDQKPIIYPSIVEFYASLTNQMRGVQ